jgi:outer membrane protein assembly factor BamB
MSRLQLLSLISVLGLASCSDPQATAEPPAAESRAAEAQPVLQPAPGADIDPAILDELEREQSRPVGGGAGLSLALGQDRPLVKVEVPRVGLATTASFSFGDGKRGWITRLPTGEVLPSVAYGNGRVYASGGFNTYAFYAMNARDGRMLWNRQNLEDNGPTAPSYLEEEVIFNTESCTLFVLDARTGKTRWKRWLGDPTLAQPAVEHGLVYASYPADGGQRIGALRLKDGRTAWQRHVDGELLTAPVVAGDAVYLTTIHGTVYSFTARRGRRRWRRSLRATSTPWIADGKLYFSRATRRGQVIHEAQIVLDAATGRTLTVLKHSRAAYLADVPRNLDSWPKVWAFEGSRPLLAAGRLLDTMAGVASATSPKTGTSLWRRRDARAGRRSLTPPVVAGSQLIFASRKGAVYALDIDTGMTVWAYDLGRPIAASPVVAKGWVYLSTGDGSIIALEAGGPAMDGWHMWGGSPAHNGKRS